MHFKVKKMKQFHISSFSGRSGISQYGKCFYELILSAKGYVKLDSKLLNIKLLDEIGIDDAVHIEIGINEAASISALYRLLDRGHRNVTITLHDPPFISWPYFRFNFRPLNALSKFAHLYLRNFGLGDRYLKQISKVFVLTHAGVRATVARYGLSNVFYLPFLVNPAELRLPVVPPPSNLIFFGFIGKNKGLDYALALHEQLLVSTPQCRLLVVGDVIDERSSKYFRKLRYRYVNNVEYLGFVKNLQEVFDQASIAMLPFSAYRSIIPASASMITAMTAGKVVCATAVNAIPEFVRDGDTGILLEKNLSIDVERVQILLAAKGEINRIACNAAHLLRTHHCPESVRHAFENANGN